MTTDPEEELRHIYTVEDSTKHLKMENVSVLIKDFEAITCSMNAKKVIGKYKNNIPIVSSP